MTLGHSARTSHAQQKNARDPLASMYDEEPPTPPRSKRSGHVVIDIREKPDGDSMSRPTPDPADSKNGGGSHPGRIRATLSKMCFVPAIPKKGPSKKNAAVEDNKLMISAPIPTTVASTHDAHDAPFDEITSEPDAVIIRIEENGVPEAKCQTTGDPGGFRSKIAKLKMKRVLVMLLLIPILALSIWLSVRPGIRSYHEDLAKKMIVKIFYNRHNLGSCSYRTCGRWHLCSALCLYFFLPHVIRFEPTASIRHPHVLNSVSSSCALVEHLRPGRVFILLPSILL